MTDTTITYRQLTAHDAQSLRIIRLESLQQYPYNYEGTYETERLHALSVFADRISNNIIMGAWHHEQLVGIAALSQDTRARNGHKGHLYMVYVRPSHQNNGIARSIVTALLARAETLYEQVLLSVEASNASAIHLYQRLGFTQYGYEHNAAKTDDGSYMDDVFMVKFLCPNQSPFQHQ